MTVAAGQPALLCGRAEVIVRWLLIWDVCGRLLISRRFLIVTYRVQTAAGEPFVTERGTNPQPEPLTPQTSTQLLHLSSAAHVH